MMTTCGEAHGLYKGDGTVDECFVTSWGTG